MTVLKRRDLLNILKSNGFFSARSGRHEIFQNGSGFSIPVPYHRVIAAGTLRDIFKLIEKSKKS